MDMRTNIVLNDRLVKEALKYSEARTKKDLVNEALTAFVAMKSRKDLRDLRGKIRFADGYDYKALRSDKKR
jgi:Arc/MetJ family transcription regulator